MNTKYLKHYGVKGMKWGVRRDRHATSLKKGTIVKTFSDRDTLDINNRRTFVSTNERDHNKMFASLDKKHLEHTIELKKNMKIADNDVGRKALEKVVLSDTEELYNLAGIIQDMPDFARSQNSPKLYNLSQKATDDFFNKRQISNNVYEVYNIIGTIGRSDSSKKLQNKFFKELKDQGYTAIHDKSAENYSHSAKNTLIMFGGDDYMKTIERRRLGKAEIEKRINQGVHDIYEDGLQLYD